MAKMRQSLVPVILLAAVALSSSNVLPIISINHLDTEQLGFNSPNDNTFRDKLQNRNILNDVFYKISIGTSLNDRLPKVRKLPDFKFDDYDNNRGEGEYVPSKDENNNGEGYRKEQWHNYPRQLDRLHSYLYRQHKTDKRNPDPDDPDNGNVEVVPETHRNSEYTNEFLYSNDGAQNIYDTDELGGKRTVKKRLFSLWSRLQSLNHKGHELQHRRHLHAFYGLADGDGNGVLTAETRATLMRPPGSPLRWG